MPAKGSATFLANYERLSDILAHMPIIDSHEHLPGEDDRTTRIVDFSIFFSHYCRTDLAAAGMAADDIVSFLDSTTPLDRKWRLVQPYMDLIKDGSYWRAASNAMEKFYGMSALGSIEDAAALTERIKEANRIGLYRQVLKDACNIALTLNYRRFPFDPEFFRPVLFVTPFAEVTKSTMRSIEKKPTWESSCLSESGCSRTSTKVRLNTQY